MSDRRYLQYFGLCFFAATGVFVFLLSETLSRSDLQTICLAGSIFVLLALAYTHWTRENGIWSISGVYLLVFALFHCGLVLVAGLRMKISPEFSNYLKKWMYSGDTKTAILLVVLAICTYQAGVTLASLIRRTPPNRIAVERGSAAIPVIGLFMVAAAFAGWGSMIVFHGGLGLLGGSYSDYLDTTPGSFRGWMYFFIGVGLIFLAASPPSRSRRLGVGIFAVFSVLAMAMGLRGEVLFPAFSALAVSGMKKYPIAAGKAVLLGFCLLSTIAVVRQMRQVGFLEYRFSFASMLPADALAEMGASIRPVVEVVSWTRTGEKFMHGSSYWAPIDRALVYLIPGWHRPAFGEDERLLGPIIGRRAGAIGFSSVAEAYINFGRWGVVFFMLFLGFLFGRLDHWPPEPFRQLTAGVILFPFIMQIRNTFLFLPASMLIALLLVWITSLVSRFATATRARRLAV